MMADHPAQTQMQQQKKPFLISYPPLAYCSFANSIRQLVLLSALISFTLISANTTAFSLAIICMTGGNSSTNNTVHESINFTTNAASSKTLPYTLTASEQNSLFSAAAIGSILSGLAITSLISAFGLRIVLSAYGFLSALSCLALPLTANFGFIPLFFARMLQGAAGPAQYVMIGAIARDWAPVLSYGAYLMILSSHFQFGRVVSMPLTAIFCASDFGWPMLYFLLGLLTLFFFTIFYLLFRDSPKDHPLVSEIEFRKIIKGKSGSQMSEELAALSLEEIFDRNQQQIPYRQIFSDLVVWLVLLTYWSDEIGFELLGQFGPTYLNRILHIDIRHTGLFSSLPYLLSVFVKVFAGWLYRRLPCTNERSRINLFTALSQLGMAFCFFSLATLPLMPKIPSWIIQIAYSCVNLFCGLDFLGVVKSSQRISQQFSHVLMAWNSIISSITVILLPFAVTILAPENLVFEWSRIFAGIASLQLIMVLLFFVFCNSEPREWTKQKKKNGLLKEHQQQEMGLGRMKNG